MSYEDLEVHVKEVWEKTKNVINNGIEINILNGKRYNNFPNASENSVAHVRPHGTDSSDTYPLPGGGNFTKQCFWLNPRYIAKELIKDTFFQREDLSYPKNLKTDIKIEIIANKVSNNKTIESFDLVEGSLNLSLKIKGLKSNNYHIVWQVTNSIESNLHEVHLNSIETIKNKSNENYLYQFFIIVDNECIGKSEEFVVRFK